MRQEIGFLAISIVQIEAFLGILSAIFIVNRLLEFTCHCLLF